MKKSWHPQTFANIEKVWKAEQKDAAEKRKIEQLQKELQQERAQEEVRAHGIRTGVLQYAHLIRVVWLLSSTYCGYGCRAKSQKLDWMYNGGAARDNDREDYLLGKAIDRNVFKPDAHPTEVGCNLEIEPKKFKDVPFCLRFTLSL
jgi:hypothetical protein